MYTPKSDYQYKNPNKVYTEVIARHKVGGQIIPVRFRPEGRDTWITIDRIKYTEQRAAVLAGGQGILYRAVFTVDEQEYECSLFHSRDDWFVQRKPGQKCYE